MSDQPWLQRWCRVVIAGSGIAAFARGQQVPAAFGLLVPCVLALFFQVRWLPGWCRSLADWLLRGLLALVIAHGISLTLLFVLSDQTLTLVGRTIGFALGLLACLFLLAEPVWRPRSPALLAALGLFVVASSTPAVDLRIPLITALVASFLHLGDPGKPWLRRLFYAAWVAGAAFCIARFLPWAQPRVEEATARMINPQGPAYSGLGPTSRLGEIAELALSHTVVLRMTTSQPQKLRAHVLTGFDGTTWVKSPNPSSTPLPLAPSAADFGLAEWAEGIPGHLYLVSTRDPGNEAPGSSPAPESPGAVEDAPILSRITQALLTQGALPAPLGTSLAQLPDDVPVRAGSDLILQPGAAIDVYGVVNRRHSLPQAADQCPECLQTPADLDPRVAALAHALSSPSDSPEKRIQNTLELMLRDYTYSLEVGKFRTRQPVAEFLFEKKKGYCEYFATATALLLRLQGVPTRFVNGYNVQPENYQGGRYVVRESDAHAWVEAWLEARGWVEVDATPAAQYQALHASQHGSAWETAMEWLSAHWEELWLRLKSGQWRGLLVYLWQAGGAQLLGVVGLGALAVALFRAWRRPRRTRGAPPLDDGRVAPELQALLASLDALWARRGRPRPAARTPLEDLQDLPEALATASLGEASRSIVDSYYRECFAGEKLPPSEIQALQARWQRASADASPK